MTPPDACFMCGNGEHRDGSLDGRTSVRIFDCGLIWDPKTGHWDFFHLTVYGKAETAAHHFRVLSERAGETFA